MPCQLTGSCVLSLVKTKYKLDLSGPMVLTADVRLDGFFAPVGMLEGKMDACLECGGWFAFPYSNVGDVKAIQAKRPDLEHLNLIPSKSVGHILRQWKALGACCLSKRRRLSLDLTPRVDQINAGRMPRLAT